MRTGIKTWEALAVGIGCLLCLLPASCGKEKSKEDYEWIEISTNDEFINMEEDKCYTLTADLDFKEMRLDPKKVTGFDGGGHTISNVRITGTVGEGAYGLFSELSYLYDLTLTGIEIDVRAPEAGYAGIAAGNVYEMENVNVRNCTATFFATNIGGICGLCQTTAKNCSVRDCELTIGNNNYTADYFSAGGLVGNAACHFDHCFTDGVSLVLDSGGHGTVGGFAGEVNDSIDFCAARDCEITVRKAFAICGGFAGHIAFADTAVKGCLAQRVHIENEVIESYWGQSDQSATVLAGFVGWITDASVSQCLAEHCVVEQLHTNNIESTPVAGFVGLCWKRVSSCLSIGNKVTTFTYDSNRNQAVGFVYSQRDVVINCGAVGSVCSGGHVDGFAPPYLGAVNSMLLDCCVGEAEHNSNGLEVFTAWADPVAVKDKFKLDETYWNLKEGEYPAIKL